MTRKSPALAASVPQEMVIDTLKFGTKESVMGLLESFLGTKKPDPQEEKTVRALIAVPTLVATANGKLEVAEMDTMVGICFEAPVLKDRVLDQNYTVFQDILKTIKSDGQQSVWEETKANLPSDLRKPALSFAIRMAAADGHISEAEFETLKLMAQGFDMTPEQFKTIFNDSQSLEHVKP